MVLNARYAVALGWIVIPTIANAQHPMVLDVLENANRSAPVLGEDVYRDQINSVVEDIYTENPSCDTSDIVIEKIESATANRFIFNAVVRQQMRNGWTVTATLPGCDTVPVRFMTMQENDGSLRTIRVNRGTSYAWDSLIADTLPLAKVAAIAGLSRADIPCEKGQPGKLGAIRIASESEDLGDDVFGVRYTGSWSEVWPITICERTVEVRAQFTADGDGGAYQRFSSEDLTVLDQEGG